jgi:hypothetical protein
MSRINVLLESGDAPQQFFDSHLYSRYAITHGS